MSRKLSGLLKCRNSKWKNTTNSSDNSSNSFSENYALYYRVRAKISYTKGKLYTLCCDWSCLIKLGYVNYIGHKFLHKFLLKKWLSNQKNLRFTFFRLCTLHFFISGGQKKYLNLGLHSLINKKILKSFIKLSLKIDI